MTMPPDRLGPRLDIGEPADLYVKMCELIGVILSNPPGGGGGGGPQPWSQLIPSQVEVNVVPGSNLQAVSVVGASPTRVKLWLYNQSSSQVYLGSQRGFDPLLAAWVLGPGVQPLDLEGYTGELWAQASAPHSIVAVIQGWT